MLQVLHFILALAVIAVLALAVSNDRKKSAYAILFSY
ncbi:putative membrane protein [Yersinia ruckeri]|nr:putative membrane protein [Yersinia ruckeri]